MRTPILASVLLTAAILTAAPATAAQPGEVARGGGAGYHRPAVGSCHALTMEQSYDVSAPAASVPCTEKHTSQTIASPQLAGSVDWTNLEKLYAKVAQKCYPALKVVLGKNPKVRTMSAYNAAWFIPSKRERRMGAKWLRCDLVLNGGTKLQALPTDGSPFLSGLPLPDSEARCLTARIDFTVCSRGHAFRAAGTFALSSPKHPGLERLQALAERRCPAITGTSRWRWTSPGAVSWKYTDRLMVCYAKTTS